VVTHFATDKAFDRFGHSLENKRRNSTTPTGGMNVSYEVGFDTHGRQCHLFYITVLLFGGDAGIRSRNVSY
jgi:hypothetical protein